MVYLLLLRVPAVAPLPVVSRFTTFVIIPFANCIPLIPAYLLLFAYRDVIVVSCADVGPAVVLTSYFWTINYRTVLLSTCLLLCLPAYVCLPFGLPGFLVSKSASLDTLAHDSFPLYLLV
jgi:hypothetical protein